MTEVQVSDLLIAPPNMPDPRFRECVLMVVSLDSTGSVALCLNRHTDFTTRDLPDLNQGSEILKMSVPIYWGGPVAPETLWVLHDDQWQSENTMHVNPRISVSSDRKTLEMIIQGESPKTFRIFSGFSAWGPGQLESELAGQKPWNHHHAWLIAPSGDLEQLLECPVEELWGYATGISAQTAVSNWLS